MINTLEEARGRLRELSERRAVKDNPPNAYVWIATVDPQAFRDFVNRRYDEPFALEELRALPQMVFVKILSKGCPACKGCRWFDDRGQPCAGQPFFNTAPCSYCNAQGDRPLYGQEEGDDGYKPPVAPPSKNRRQAVVGFLINETGDVFLLSRHKHDGDGFRSLPGGKVEPGETLVQALQRELREEIGIDFDADEAQCLHGAPANEHYTYIFFLKAWTGTPQAQEEGEVGEWGPMGDLFDEKKCKYAAWYKQAFFDHPVSHFDRAVHIRYIGGDI